MKKNNTIPIPFSFKNETKKAIAYYRHSAEDKQENSVPIQREHIKKFVQDNNLELIHDDADEGISGLTANRPGFQRLLKEWILNAEAPSFDFVLVYDVSRWGRFQDQDESAHYEYLCKQHGKQVIYVSRGFPKVEQELVSHLQTSIDRYMAAEYSKQLSSKVFYGQVKVAKDGYSTGGEPSYGMDRVLLDENKTPIQILKHGDHKIIANQRVTFTPSKNEESTVIKIIFDMYVKKYFTPKEIADSLNGQRIKTAKGRLWTGNKILHILTNETYIGTKLYNKTQGKLGQKRKRNPRNEWIICQSAFTAIIDEKIFYEAQDMIYLLNSKWKYGRRIIYQTTRQIKTHLDTMLQKQNYSDDLRSEIIRNLPIIYGVTHQENVTPQWCFLINDIMRLHDYVIAVGLNLAKQNIIDKFFTLPINEFGAGNFLVLSAKDTSYQDYATDKDQTEEKMLQLCQQIAKRV